MSVSAEKISELCDALHERATGDANSICVNFDTINKLGLIKNGVIFHELDYDSLYASIFGLTKTILLPSHLISEDHIWMWSWCGQLLLSYNKVFSGNERSIHLLFDTAIRFSLGSSKLIGGPNHEVIRSCIVFPLLEALAKLACCEFILLDGTVIKDFTLKKVKGKIKYKRTDVCSSLKDILILLYDSTQDDKLKMYLDKFRNYFFEIDNNVDPFDLIYKIRCMILHGNMNFLFIGSAILNMSILIALTRIKNDFEKHRLETLQHLAWDTKHRVKRDSSYYPVVPIYDFQEYDRI